MKITTTQIINRINADFGATYKNAVPFVGSGPLWNFCINVISDPTKLNSIIFANDMQIPPVKSLLHIYSKTHVLPPNFKFTKQENQWLGAFMGFVFKFVLNYKSQKERIKVDFLGVGTATRFYDVESEVTVTE
jgi:hypothetical protein